MEVIKNRKLSPEIRFPYFNYEWKNSKLGAICEMKAGKFIKASEITQKYSSILYPCYGGNGLRGFTKIYNHEGKYSLIGRQGALCGNVKLVDGKFHATEHALVVYLEQELNADWVYYLLCTLNLNQYSTGQAQPGLSVSNLNAIKVKLPINIDEQQKIASFLSKVDEKITLLTKKKELLEEYKKGVTQKIFKQEIRFKIPNEAGELVEPPKWEKRKLGDYLEHKSKRNKQLIVETILSVSNSKGFILQSDQFENHRIASKDVSNYKIVHKNDVAYNPSRINVGSIAILKDFDVGIISPMYVVFSLKNGLELSFFESLIETHLFKHLVKVGCSGSVRDSLNFEDLENFKLSLPKVEEQQKIASFISSIDKKISAVDNQLSLAKEWKKGLLQKMFV